MTFSNFRGNCWSVWNMEALRRIQTSFNESFYTISTNILLNLIKLKLKINAKQNFSSNFIKLPQRAQSISQRTQRICDTNFLSLCWSPDQRNWKCAKLFIL